MATRVGTADALDDVSKAIVEQLQQDGRRSYSAIGKVVGLSEAAVRQRVAKLLESEIIQIVAVTDPLQVGFTRMAMVGVIVSGDIEAVAAELREFHEVDYLVVTAGGFDILAEVVCEDDDHLLELINRRIRALPDVLRTETFVYLQLRKQIYTWGTR
ncbi:MAG: Lrp/AsnC family transcriptional regulator [Actinobacteria bacterium]|nr:Lrp/AsnC family transcriptional regulator [Actinomycetota bacterium]MCB9412854.1 Lrp/AsnC family transcriptional regulator [Actinomycetota bacterium]